jgi:hypothetical protein
MHPPLLPVHGTLETGCSPEMEAFTDDEANAKSMD